MSRKGGVFREIVKNLANILLLSSSSPSATISFRPACRNGRRGRLKIYCVHARMGSSPIAGTTCNHWVLDNPVILFSRDFYLRL